MAWPVCQTGKCQVQKANSTTSPMHHQHIPPCLLEAGRHLTLIVGAARPGGGGPRGARREVYEIGARQLAAPAAARQRVCMEVVRLEQEVHGSEQHAVEGKWDGEEGQVERGQEADRQQPRVALQRALSPLQLTLLVYASISGIPPCLSWCWATKSRYAGTCFKAALSSWCLQVRAACGCVLPASGDPSCKTSSKLDCKKCCMALAVLFCAIRPMLLFAIRRAHEPLLRVSVQACSVLRSHVSGGLDALSSDCYTTRGYVQNAYGPSVANARLNSRVESKQEMYTGQP